MVEQVKIHMSSRHNSCKNNNMLVVIRDKRLKK